MKNKLKYYKHLLLGLSVILGLVLYVSYFYKFIKSGGYGYNYIVLILIGAILLTCYFIANCIINFKKKSIFLWIVNIVGLVLSIISIILYINLEKRYIFGINEFIFIYEIALFIGVLELGVHNFIVNKKINENYLIFLVVGLGFLGFEAIELYGGEFAYEINIDSLFVFGLLASAIVSSISQKINKVGTKILIVLSCLIFMIIGVYAKGKFSTMNEYNNTILLMTIASLFLLICSLNDFTIEKNRKSLINNIFNCIGVFVIILVFIKSKTIETPRPSDITLINPYRIILFLPLLLLIIKPMINKILEKDLISIGLTGIIFIGYLVVTIILFIHKDERYRIFFTEYLILSSIMLFSYLVINGYLIFDGFKENKKLKLND